MPGQKREARLRARCPGHPRLSLCEGKDVDGRDKPGHDGECGSAVSYSALLTSLIRGSASSIRPR
ncbi:hypothetical protein V1279_001553 [Bradyrhizobium sp. AZCC 1610]